MKYFIGIDPGARGAISILTKEGKAVDVFDMPMLAKEVDKYRFVEIFSSYDKEETFVTIERKTVGITEAIVMALGFPHEIVRPQVWKKEFGLIKKDKSYSIKKGQQLYPELAIRLSPKTRDGRSESLLIAEFGRRFVVRDDGLPTVGGGSL